MRTTTTTGAATAGARQDRRWVTVPRPDPGAAVRLYCLPYAGAGASAYRPWVAELAGTPVELAPVQLPGRETRLREDPTIDVDDMAAEVLRTLDRPYAVYGHSLGARLAFELVRRLRTAGAPPPRHLLVSGCPAPDLSTGPRDSDLPDDEFLDRIRGMGGTPGDLFDVPELRELLLPVIRSDFAAVDDYRFRPGPPLDCPITAMAGDRDPEGTPEQMAGWHRQTAASFALHVLPGDHFFLHSARADVLARLGAALTGPGDPVTES